MGIIPAQNKIQPTSNEQRNYTSSGTSSRRKSFIQPLNAQGEVMSIPTGHTVPYGYKNCKLAEKHFKAGVLWYQEQQQTSCKAFD
jgi:hypothetical protein